jgi:hypothetical protein
MHCGAIGHWAGDPACKFPGSRRQGQKRDQFRVRDGNVFQAEFKANTMPATANFVHVKTKHTPQGKTQKLFKQTRETTLKNIAWNTYTTLRRNRRKSGTAFGTQNFQNIASVGVF